MTNYSRISSEYSTRKFSFSLLIFTLKSDFRVAPAEIFPVATLKNIRVGEPEIFLGFEKNFDFPKSEIRVQIKRPILQTVKSWTKNTNLFMKYLKYFSLLWQNMKWQKISIWKGNFFCHLIWNFLPFGMDFFYYLGDNMIFHLLNNHKTVLNQAKSRLFCDWLKDDKILKILRLVEGLGYLYFMILVNCKVLY